MQRPDPPAARISELEAMLAASEEHTQHWEAEAIRLRRLLSPFAKSEACRGFGGDLIQIYVVRDDVRAACKEFAGARTTVPQRGRLVPLTGYRLSITVEDGYLKAYANPPDGAGVVSYGLQGRVRETRDEAKEDARREPE